MENEAGIKKIMPHDTEAETSVLGSMLMDVKAVDSALEILTAEDFYTKSNGVIFEAMRQIHTEGSPIDPVTLSARLKEMNVPDELAGTDHIRELLESVPTSANIKYYARIVHEKSLLRKLIRTCEDIASDCYKGTESVEAIMDEAEKEIFSLVRSGKTEDFVPVSEIVIAALAKIEEAAKTKGGITGLSTGFKDLDLMTTGLQKSDFILVAARPSMGKTAFALSILDYVVCRKDQSAAIFSLEMSREQLINRLFAMEARIDAQKIRSGNLEDEEWESLMESAEVIGGSKLIIDDTPGLTVTELRSKCRKYKLDHDISLVVVDYIQLMSSGSRAESRQQELSDISRSLKSLARELDIPIIALSQLNRSVETRADHRPMMSDIRESGAIEQDADVIMFLYRDDYYNPETDERNVAEVIIAKQRNGPTGTIKLTWQPKYTRFVNMARDTDKFK